MYGWMLVVRTNRYIHYQLELKGGKNFRPKTPERLHEKYPASCPSSRPCIIYFDVLDQAIVLHCLLITCNY